MRRAAAAPPPARVFSWHDPRNVLRGLALAALTVLAGCASGQMAAPPSPPPALGHAPAPSPAIPSLADLPGWADEDHAAALRAFQDSCGVAREAALRAVCRRARAQGRADELAARVFLETNFRPALVPGPGLLTAYFTPEYPARRAPDAVFSAPVLPRPADLVYAPPTSGVPGGRPQAVQLGPDGQSWPYPDRAGIGLLAPDAALAWMRPEDLFFLQIQGSGVLDFPDGATAKAVYAGDNGRPFVAIAGPMARQGLLEAGHASGQAIRAWLRTHAGPDAQAVMDLDPRYVFFALAPDDGAGPVGAAGAPLPPGRAVAIDRSWHDYGGLYWVDAAAPTLAGAVKTYRRLVVALDTGGAIRGAARADLYLGRGEAAGDEAGRVRHTLQLIALVPVEATGREADAAP